MNTLTWALVIALCGLAAVVWDLYVALRYHERREQKQAERIKLLEEEVAHWRAQAQEAERDLDAERQLHAALEDAGVDVVVREMPVMHVWSRQN